MSPPPALSVVVADLDLPRHQAAIVGLLGTYADDPDTGGGEAMSAQAAAALVPALREHPTAVVLIAEAADEAVGLAISFEGMSTFAARPLLNLHDLVVHPDWRGTGVGGTLLDGVEDHARRRGCVSITLEVLGTNLGAQRLYRRHGFVGGDSIDPPSAAMFFKKTLS